MSEVFLSYASEDRQRVALIATALRNEGFDVWWDRDVPVAGNYRDFISGKLQEARAVVATWSPPAVASPYVLWEANNAHNRGVLVPAIIEESDLPPEFFLLQAVDLRDWNGEADRPEWRRLVAAVTQLVRKSRRSAPPVPTHREALRLVAFADLHLDSLFSWAKTDVARQRRQNLRDALDNIIKLAHETNADALLCGGDLYEQARFTPDTLAFLQRSLNDCAMRVFLSPGNHDWYGPDSIYARAGWAPHVTVFTEPLLRRCPLADGFTLWGAAHCGPANTPGFFDRGFRADGQGVHIALFHGSEQSLLGFERGDKKPHAPFNAAQIAEAGLRYAFVGHFHRPRDEERLSYPGNPDPISFGDLSCSGAIVADIDQTGAVTLQRHDVSVSAIHDLFLDITGCDTSQQVRERMASLVAGLAGCARVTVAGEANPTLDLRLEDLSTVAGSLEQIVVEVGSLRAGYDLAGLLSDPTVRGEFVRMVTDDSSLTDDERRRILVTGLRALDGRTDLEVA